MSGMSSRDLKTSPCFSQHASHRRFAGLGCQDSKVDMKNEMLASHPLHLLAASRLRQATAEEEAALAGKLLSEVM